MKINSSPSSTAAYNFTKFEFWRWIVWFGLIAIIITASLLNNEPLHRMLKGQQDKILHIIVFFGFLVVTKLLIKELSNLKIAIITFGLGLLIEVLQGIFTNGMRQFDLFDIYFNLIGIALGFFILLIYTRKTITIWQ